MEIIVARSKCLILQHCERSELHSFSVSFCGPRTSREPRRDFLADFQTLYFLRRSQDKNSLLGFFPLETSVQTRIKFLCFKWSISTPLFHQVVKCINCEKDVIALEVQ